MRCPRSRPYLIRYERSLRPRLAPPIAPRRRGPILKRALDGELDGHELDGLQAALAHRVDDHLDPDQLAGHQALEVVDAFNDLAVQVDDEILCAETRLSRGAAFYDLDHLDALGAAELAGEARGQRPRAARDAEVGAAKPPLAHQRPDDLAGRRVDRDGQAESDAGDGRVDPDHAALAVGERSAGIAGVQGRVGLNHVLDDPPCGAGA